MGYEFRHGSLPMRGRQSGKKIWRTREHVPRDLRRICVHPVGRYVRSPERPNDPEGVTWRYFRCRRILSAEWKHDRQYWMVSAEEGAGVALGAIRS